MTFQKPIFLALTITHIITITPQTLYAGKTTFSIQLPTLVNEAEIFPRDKSRSCGAKNSSLLQPVS